MPITLLALLVATTAAGPMPVTVEQRNALRDACAKVHGDAPETPATRAAFKACLDQIPYDGDLPPRRRATRP